LRVSGAVRYLFLAIACMPLLAQDLPVPKAKTKPASPAPKTTKISSPTQAPSTGTLLVTCDLDCNWKLDGKAKGSLVADDSATETLPLGQHVVVATSMDSKDRSEQEVSIKTGEQTAVIVHLASAREARLLQQSHEELEKKRQQEKAAADSKDGEKDNFKDFFDRFFGEKGQKPEKASGPNEVKLGLIVKQIEDTTGTNLRIKGVVIDSVQLGSFADAQGLKSGWVIIRINKRPTETQEEFQAVMNDLKTGDDVVFEVMDMQRPGTGPFFVAGTL
jgi:hypothetical protein